MRANLITIFMTIVCTAILYFGAQFFVMTTGSNFLFIPMAILAIGFIVFTNQSFSVLGSAQKWGRKQVHGEAYGSLTDPDWDKVDQLVSQGMTQGDAINYVFLSEQIDTDNRK